MDESGTNIECLIQDLNDKLESLEKQITNKEADLKRKDIIGLDDDYSIDPMKF